jgi:hypothetical protein
VLFRSYASANTVIVTEGLNTKYAPLTDEPIRFPPVEASHHRIKTLPEAVVAFKLTLLPHTTDEGVALTFVGAAGWAKIAGKYTKQTIKSNAENFIALEVNNLFILFINLNIN